MPDQQPAYNQYAFPYIQHQRPLQGIDPQLSTAQGYYASPAGQHYSPQVNTAYPQGLYNVQQQQQPTAPPPAPSQSQPPPSQQPQQQRQPPAPTAPHHPSRTPSTSSSRAPSPPPDTKGKRRANPTKDKSGPTPKKVKKTTSEPADGSASPQARGEKVKLTRGSRACTVCRRLKMKCEGAELGPPCKRCAQGAHECIFEESQRGKRNSNRKQEDFSQSLHKLERTLDTVLQAMPSLNGPSSTGNTTTHANTQSRTSSPSPSHPTDAPTTASHPTTTSHPPSSPPPPASSLPSAPESPLPGLPDNALNPLGLLAEASLSADKSRRSRQAQTLEQFEDVLAAQETGVGTGIAGEAYFRPGPMTILPVRRMVIERQIQPEILTFVEMSDVLELFKIFFEHINVHCCLLDASFHTPSLVCSRSPFLLTVICAIASKYYKEHDDLHLRLNNVAKKLAFSVPAQGFKSVEIVQSYLLLALWGAGPVQRFEQDRTWLMLGMGIRMATDLNLHRKNKSVGRTTAHVREVRNMERTWLMCYNLDRSLSSQMGKPYSIKEDFIIRNAQTWWKHPEALPSDAALCGFLEYQRIMSRCIEFLYSGISDPSGLLRDCDFMLLVRAYETQLTNWKDNFLSERMQENWNDPDRQYRVMTGGLHHHYCMLVINSFGLNNARERSPVDIAHFFSRCYSSAVACAKIITEQLGPSGYLKYSPDSHFVLCSYAVLTLLKLVRPEFQAFLPDPAGTIQMVASTADMLARVAVNRYHTPALYAHFLRALITAKTDGTSAPQTRSGSPMHAQPHQHGSSTEVSEGLTPALSFGQDQNMMGHDMSPHQQHQHQPHQHHSQHQQQEHQPQLSYPTTTVQNDSDPALTLSNGMGPLGIYDGAGEMGPLLDFGDYSAMGIGAPVVPPGQEDYANGLPFNHILTNDFWDSVLIPGYSSALEGLSGGFVYGSGGSGLITPQVGSPFGAHADLPHVPPEHDHGYGVQASRS